MPRLTAYHCWDEVWCRAWVCDRVGLLVEGFELDWIVEWQIVDCDPLLLVLW